MPQILSPLLVETPKVSNVVVTILPSGDTTGATDTAAINAVLTAGGSVVLAQTGTNWSGGQTPYYINAPLTPVTGSSLCGATPWQSSNADNYGEGAGLSGGTVIYITSTFSGTGAISMSNSTGTQAHGVILKNFTLEGGVQPTGYGIYVDGAWGACIMEGVCVNNTFNDCVHFKTDATSNVGPDDWMIVNCKFSASFTGYGFWTDNLPDSWIITCESSENHLDNWWIGFSLNTHMTNCKGENSATGGGFHLTGHGGTGRTLSLTDCSTHLNHSDGFLFDGTSSGSAAGGYYMLSNCQAISDNVAAGTTFSGFRASGSVDTILATNCYAFGAYYGASQVSSSNGMSFINSSLSGTNAATHDDNSNTSALINATAIELNTAANYSLRVTAV